MTGRRRGEIGAGLDAELDAEIGAGLDVDISNLGTKSLAFIFNIILSPSGCTRPTCVGKQSIAMDTSAS